MLCLAWALYMPKMGVLVLYVTDTQRLPLTGLA
jgi:hypothetical protein